MNRKQLAKILPTIVGIGFCLIEALKLAFQFQATDKRDIASGHVEAIRFAPVISANWDYITRPQMIVLCVVMVAVMALAAVMLTSRFWVRSGALEGESGPSGPAKATVHSDSVGTPSPSEAPEPRTGPTPATPPGLRTFGRARR